MLIKHTSEKEMTWAEIKAAAEAGTIRELLSSGDRIPVTMKTGEAVEFDVTYDANGKCYFVTHDCLAEQYIMRKGRTNRGGWARTDMRAHLNTDVFLDLPDELQEIIVPTKIVQELNGERIECEDKLFLLSLTQVRGKGWWSDAEPEDTQLDIFPTERSRVKECGDHGTWWYWTRSPVSSSSANYCIVNYIGNSSTNISATSSYGVSFGFCLNP